MSGGSGNFIGGPWLLIRRAGGGRDRPTVGVEEFAQARATALRHLAVLLSRPAMTSTEGGAATPGDLMGDDQPLILSELAGSINDATQLAAHHHERLEIRATVDERRIARLAHRDRQSRRQRRADRAAPGERAAHVPDPRHHAQLERVRDVRVAGKSTAPTHLSEQLKSRLGMTVLEVLAAQHSPVGTEQDLALGVRDARDGILLQACPRSARKAARGLAATSSRHTGMSTRAAHDPPFEFRGAPVRRRCGAGRRPRS
jgi:hypothetical protein